MAMATETAAEGLRQQLETRTARIGVVGLGYVGLPLIDAFLRAEFPAIGFDVDPRKIERLNAGQSYIAHIESSRVQGWRDSGRFEATADMSRRGWAATLWRAPSMR